MYTEKKPTMTDKTYNGWKNHETWNVALWIQKDEGWYAIAREVTDYKMWLRAICESKTLDGVNLFGKELDVSALDEMILDL